MVLSLEKWQTVKGENRTFKQVNWSFLLENSRCGSRKKTTDWKIHARTKASENKRELRKYLREREWLVF